MLRALVATIIVSAAAITAVCAQTPPNNFPSGPPTHLPPQAQRQTYEYTARTATAVSRSGAVVALGVHWTCAETTCTVTGPWPQPLMPGCVVLAHNVGRIVSFGRIGAQFNDRQIERCNAGLPASVIAPPTPAPDHGVELSTAELSAVGGAVSTTPPPVIPPPMSFTTPELSVVGGATSSITPTPLPPPVSLTTQELSVVGN